MAPPQVVPQEAETVAVAAATAASEAVGVKGPVAVEGAVAASGLKYSVTMDRQNNR